MKPAQELKPPNASSRLGWKYSRGQGRAGNGTRSLRKRGVTANIRGDYILGCVPTSVRDRSGIPTLVAQGEIDVLDHSPERPGRRLAVRHSNKRDLRGNPSGPRGPVRRPTFCRRSSHSTEKEDTEQGNSCKILPRPLNSLPTAPTPLCPRST
jgi:hypothetical protein